MRVCLVVLSVTVLLMALLPTAAAICVPSSCAEPDVMTCVRQIDACAKNRASDAKTETLKSPHDFLAGTPRAVIAALFNEDCRYQ